MKSHRSLGQALEDGLLALILPNSEDWNRLNTAAPRGRPRALDVHFDEGGGMILDEMANHEPPEWLRRKRVFLRSSQLFEA